MNCEKCEPLLLDELYEELDEVTSAAVQRHVAGCSSCADILEGLRSTRSAVSLPLEPVPAGLEDRIMASAAEAAKVVPIQQGRAARAVAWAGRWAMRPQTAMAAVFLLMIGTSAFVLRSRAPVAPQSVSVTVQGSPAAAASVASAEEGSLDDKSAAQAHGATAPATPPPVVAAAPPAPAATAAAPGALASKDEPARGGDEDQLGGALAAKKTDLLNAGPAAGAPRGGASLADDLKGNAQAESKPKAEFSSGMAAYNARRFGEATEKFDGVAKSGDSNAGLWAARSTREGTGCAAAVKRFDQVAAQARGTAAGRNATLEAARCYRILGNYAVAQQRLAELEGTDLAVAAKEEKARVETMARAGETTRGGAPAAAAAAPAAPRKAAAPAAPARAEAAPAPKPAPMPRSTAADRASGF